MNFIKNHHSQTHLIVFLFVALLFSSCSNNDNDNSDTQEHTFTVGALLSLEGEWSTLGKNSQAALEIAVTEINDYFTAKGSNHRIAIEVYDTELKPDLALNYLKTSVSEGKKFIIGPQSSGELSALKSYSDQHDVIIISHGSTAGSLSIPDDNIFRFCPDDKLEGEAMADRIYSQGIKSVVAVSRDDVGNIGLVEGLTTAFNNMGGNVHPIDPYGEDLSDFSSVISEIHMALENLLANNDSSEIGVYLAAFDECSELFEQASLDPLLSEFNWFGGDGVVNSADLIASTEASNFAIETGFIAPNFDLPENARSKWGPLSDQIEAITGNAPSAFALAAYDALWVSALTYEATGFSDRDFALLKGNFEEQAENYSGATGPTELNNNGDRSVAVFGFWGIVYENGSYQWKLIDTSDD